MQVPNERSGGDVEPGRQSAHVAALEDYLGSDGHHVAEHPGLDTLKALSPEFRSLHLPTRGAAQKGAELGRRWCDDDARACTSGCQQGAGAVRRLAADREERQISILVRALLDQWRRRKAASIEYGKHRRVVFARAKACQYGDARWLVHDLQRVRGREREERRFRYRIEQSAEHMDLVLYD
jgi:hypothetical protein